MAKTAYIGVGGTARKTRKCYVGVDGVARKIRRAYIGVGGVARLCWRGGVLSRYDGIVPGITRPRHDVATASVGNYALFCGGTDSGSHMKLESYDKSLNLKETSSVRARSSAAGATIGDYAIFAGGATYGSNNTMAEILTSAEAYDSSLTSYIPDSLSIKRYGLKAATVGDYAIFAGGVNGQRYVDSYDKSLTHRKVEDLINGHRAHAAATVGDYALFAGGVNADNYVSAEVSVYDKYASRRTSVLLPAYMSDLAGATVGGYAIFTGRNASSTGESRVGIYDKSLTRVDYVSTLRNLSHHVGVSMDGYALFTGGFYGNSYDNREVYAFDDTLTLVAVDPLAKDRRGCAAATVGDYALFAGGADIKGTEAYVVK